MYGNKLKRYQKLVAKYWQAGLGYQDACQLAKAVIHSHGRVFGLRRNYFGRVHREVK